MALKVFNWLNRKKQSNIEYCAINENKVAMEEKEDSAHASVSEQDTEALLLRDVLINGILAIGTLGHKVNSLCPESCIEDETFIVVDEKAEEQKCEEEKTKAKEDITVTATEVFSSSDIKEKCCPKTIIVAGASTSKPTSCMENMHHKKPTSKPLKATRKLSRVMRKMLGKKIHPDQLKGDSNAEGPITARC
ncbi:hypothetical protein E2562_022236 [Oryza meyeriana var. granulata]|uniref:Protein TILLER ANGLE CONTROL 1 n=1 Tax=Oryza meyeriana var. granulata TaxID=110450 RepID=A0A6G1ENY1_9ORYZ|nr:hypothetical protein E2562_022236 [Oryza meyeriana var. granulata]